MRSGGTTSGEFPELLLAALVNKCGGCHVMVAVLQSRRHESCQDENGVYGRLRDSRTLSLYLMLVSASTPCRVR